MVASLGTAEVRAALAIPDDVLALNAGTRGPMSNAAWDAMHWAQQQERTAFGERPGYLDRYERVHAADRTEVARLICCKPEDVALCESTTVGLNIVLWGCDLKAGDELLSTSLENAAAVVPLRVFAERRGVRLKFLQLGDGEVDLTDVVAGAITARTKAILVSDVDCATGTRFDLGGISTIAHERGILVLADGVQAVGACPVDVGALQVDAYALARHKFLCGPEGAGALYVSSAVRDRIHPTFAGVFSDASHGGADRSDLYDDSRRYEVSTRALAMSAGGAAGLRWMCDDVGWDRIFDVTAQRVAEMRAALAGVPGVRLLGSDAPGGGLVAFAVEGLDPDALASRLTAHRVLCRPVFITRTPCVRLSVGFWSRESDADAIARVLRTLI